MRTSKPVCFIVLGLLHLFLGAASNAMGTTKKWVEQKTKNGLEVVLFPSSKVPLATIVLVSKAGARSETAEINGLTHLWEHMFFKGNARLKDQEAFNRRVRELGIVFNGDTSAEIVRYYFTLPSANLMDGLQFMADAISTPLLEEKELERERKVVLDEYDRAASQPSFDLNNIERMLMYKNLEFQRNALGRRRIIETATRDQLLQIKNEVFVPANCALVVSGDFDRNAILKDISRIFSDWSTPQNWKPVATPKFLSVAKTEEVVVRHKQAQNAMIQITFNGPKAALDEKDTYSADVLVNLLSHRSSAFYKKFNDSGLTLQSGLGYHTQGLAGELVLYSQVPVANLEKAKALFYLEPNEWVKAGYFRPEILADVREQVVVSHEFELNKPSDYAKTLAFWWGTTGIRYLSSYVSNIRKVSIKDVQFFIQKYLLNKPRLTTILVNETEAEKLKIEDNSRSYRDQLLKNY